MTFTQHKIMDMINKAVARAREHQEETDAMYYALYNVACFSITREEFAKLILNPVNEYGPSIYREVLWSVTRRTYEAFR